MQLTDKEWKEFYISGENGLFNLESTSSGIDKNKLNALSGDIPYITRTDNNNGIVMFVTDSQKDKYRIDSNNVISIGLDTQTVFYQPYKFLTGQNIQVLSNSYLNKYNAQFISTLLKIQLKKFNWGGNGATLGRLRRTKILLPANAEGNPDYAFMEAYVKEQENKKKQEYLEYAKKIVAKLEYKEIQPLKEKEWGEFFISDICNIESGQDIYDAERIVGKTPYITSTASNNGIKYFIDNCNKTLEAEAISVNRNGSVGYCFYHKYNALYSNDCRKLRLIIGKNEFVSLFITNQVTQQREKYNYGYKMGTGRLNRQKILVPIDDMDKPDYAYMEQYIKNIMNAQLNKYLCFSKL